MSNREQAKFLAVLYSVPAALFLGVVAVHQTGPTAARLAADVAEAASDAADAAATHASTMVSGGAASVGVKRVVVTDQGARFEMTYGEWLNEKDRAVRERVNNRRAEPEWLSHPWSHWEKVQ